MTPIPQNDERIKEMRMIRKEEVAHDVNFTTTRRSSECFLA